MDIKGINRILKEMRWYVMGFSTLQVRRSSKTWPLAKDQVLRGPLVYLGLTSRSLSPSFFHIWSSLHPQFFGMRATNDDRKLHRLNAELTWTPFETVDAWLESIIFFNHLQITVITAPNGFFQFTMKATKNDIPELLQSQFVAVPLKKLLMILHLFPNWKNGSWGFTLGSRS